MSNHYSPYEQFPPKPLWDEAIRDRGVTVEKWLYNCDTVVGLWFRENMLTLKEFVEANAAIEDLSTRAGLNRACLHCSSRATVHKCSECHNKGETT